MHIAVIVDEPESLASMIQALKSAAPSVDPIRCDVFPDTAALRLALREQTFDLLVLDTFLSSRRVLAFVAWLRGTCKSFMSVLVLGERSKAHDVAKALSAGANDYVITPFRPSELLSRDYRFRTPGAAARSHGGAADECPTRIPCDIGRTCVSSDQFARLSGRLNAEG